MVPHSSTLTNLFTKTHHVTEHHTAQHHLKLTKLNVEKKIALDSKPVDSCLNYVMNMQCFTNKCWISETSGVHWNVLNTPETLRNYVLKYIITVDTYSAYGRFRKYSDPFTFHTLLHI